MQLLLCVLVLTALATLSSAASDNPEDYEVTETVDPETGQIIVTVTEKPHNNTARIPAQKARAL